MTHVSYLFIYLLLFMYFKISQKKEKGKVFEYP